MEIRKSEIVTASHSPYLVVEVSSDSNPDKVYRVDVTNQRCSCPSWKFSRTRTPCKHLQRLGLNKTPEQKERL